MTARNGWHPLRMWCPDCEPGHPCPTCNGTGWHPNSHVLNEGLFVADQCVAKVEAFADGGPLYANAITPAGEPSRSGPMETQANAMDWCERAAGTRPTIGERAGAYQPRAGGHMERERP